jgi:hypothetical protein
MNGNAATFFFGVWGVLPRCYIELKGYTIYLYEYQRFIEMHWQNMEESPIHSLIGIWRGDALGFLMSIGI